MADVRATTFRLGIVALALFAACACARAFAGDDGLHVEGVAIAVYQKADHSRVDGTDIHGEGAGQLYLFGTLASGPGTWNIEVRGGTTPRANGVSGFYGSNGLVGETLDADGDGRIAVTQWFYEAPMGAGKLRTGLLDPTALFDGNPVANDEYTQFLADAFINNPSIGFPSYVLGASYQGTMGDHVQYELFAGSDTGLEEGRHSYADVLHVGGRRDGHRKGAFTMAELDWRSGGYLLGFGAWFDSGRVDRISSNGTTNRHGLFLLAGTQLGAGHLQASAGIANDRAQATANFVSLAYQLPLRFPERHSTFSVAVARTGASSHLPFDSRPVYQAEAYWRIPLADSFYVTPDIQYLRNPGFRPDRGGAWIGALRVGVVF